ncbi:MAG TPA: ATP-binding protein [Steroidobacter sp.]|uniref:sensor histidine kinase n=1 Tax=Steroidobacter sp. TaxID=1978227 RepID=UPI002EDAA158
MPVRGMRDVRLRGMAGWIGRMFLAMLAVTADLCLSTAIAGTAGEPFSPANHLHYALGVLILVQAIFLVMLIVEHRRHRRARADSQRQYAEITHAARLALTGEISASIVHEVTQPLSAILSNVETAETLLRKPTPDLSTVVEILEDVRKDDLRAHGIVRKLRMLLRKRELQFEHVDVNALASSVLTLILPDALRRNVVIHTALDPALPKVPADPVHLQQVLLNLIINAMDAMDDTPAAARWLEIRTERCDPEHVQVAVADNGRGLGAGRADKLFESFFTTKPDGMGLGLSVARSIVTMHGGAIWAESSEVGGATFLFTLPVRTA